MVAALCLFSTLSAGAKPTIRKDRASAAKQKQIEKSGEDYADLIQKAQNLTLQQDRLQASQVLIRGIQRESRNSAAYKELVRVLGELTSVFYTEKTQALFSTAEASADLKPREALDSYIEALKLEDRNVLILKSIARVHLRLDECDKADPRVKTAEEVDPYSPEVKLLRLQVLACQKNLEQLSARLVPSELESVEKFSRGLQMTDLVHRKESRKAKALLATWESQAPDYPEVYNWKWQLSKGAGIVDRSSAAKYSQLCQNLTPRKRKSLGLDVDLCKAKESAEIFLREKESPPGSAAADGAGENR